MLPKKNGEGTISNLNGYFWDGYVNVVMLTCPVKEVKI